MKNLFVTLLAMLPLGTGVVSNAAPASTSAGLQLVAEGLTSPMSFVALKGGGA